VVRIVTLTTTLTKGALHKTRCERLPTLAANAARAVLLTRGT
jgi:hypothetical protein